MHTLTLDKRDRWHCTSRFAASAVLDATRGESDAMYLFKIFLSAMSVICLYDALSVLDFALPRFTMRLSRGGTVGTWGKAHTMESN